MSSLTKWWFNNFEAGRGYEGWKSAASNLRSRDNYIESGQARPESGPWTGAHWSSQWALQQTSGEFTFDWLLAMTSQSITISQRDKLSWDSTPSMFVFTRVSMWEWVIQQKIGSINQDQIIYTFALVLNLLVIIKSWRVNISLGGRVAEGRNMQKKNVWAHKWILHLKRNLTLECNMAKMGQIVSSFPSSKLYNIVQPLVSLSVILRRTSMLCSPKRAWTFHLNVQAAVQIHLCVLFMLTRLPSGGGGGPLTYDTLRPKRHYFKFYFNLMKNQGFLLLCWPACDISWKSAKGLDT